MRVTRVVSGGQSGADRAALDAALELGIPYGGWCAPDGWAEDFVSPPGVLAQYPSLRATPRGPVSTRTLWNVRDSDATLVVLLDDPSTSPGTRLTVDTADRLGRSLLVVRVEEAERIPGWLASLPSPVTLNVAGPRESEQPGLYAAARAALVTALSSRSG